MNYSSEINAYYRKAQYIGALDPNEPDVGEGVVQSSCCGSVTIYLQMQGNLIVTAYYESDGDVLLSAVAAFLVEQVIGKTLIDAFQFSIQDIASVFKPSIRQVRKMNLALRALKLAIAKCQAKSRLFNE